MKTHLKNSFCVPALVAALGLMLAEPATATVILDFPAVGGDAPMSQVEPSGLVLSGNTLYGTTARGGSYDGRGTVFKVNTDGTGYTNLHIFGGSYVWPYDASLPFGRLLLSSNTLYGTTFFGGFREGGKVFKINTDGTGY
jgi:uncharacterized repeat protein (TIGR03803 family)